MSCLFQRSAHFINSCLVLLPLHKFTWLALNMAETYRAQQCGKWLNYYWKTCLYVNMYLLSRGGYEIKAPKKASKIQ